MFGFSLLNDTKTAAVVGIAGGAVVGAGVGAGIGAAVHDSKQKAADEAALAAGKDPCENAAYREKLGAKIMDEHKELVLNDYLDADVIVDKNTMEFIKTRNNKVPNSYYNMTAETCRMIHNLVATANLYEEKIKHCLASKENKQIADEIKKLSGNKDIAYSHEVGNKVTIDLKGKVTCPSKFADECFFVPLQKGFAADNIMCTSSNGCKGVYTIQYELDELRKLLKVFEPVLDKSVIAGKKSKGSSRGADIGKGAAIGAAAGVGVGGLATAITAFVERSNITCKVGDGLNSVALGKSHTIDSLHDFYVKWNLQLPDTVAPTSVVVDAESWDQACEQFSNKLYDCPNVQINYKKDGKYELIPSACKISGNMCIRNYAVSASHGID